jgi:hypothetical protein
MAGDRTKHVARDPMFVSMPDFQFKVPSPLAPHGAKFWRSLGVSTRTPWFLLTVRSRSQELFIDTFLLAWDSDVVDTIKSLDAELESLFCLAPCRSGQGNGWTTRKLQEIWSVAPATEGGSDLLFVDADGHEFSGMFFEPSVGAVRRELIARAS